MAFVFLRLLFSCHGHSPARQSCCSGCGILLVRESSPFCGVRPWNISLRTVPCGYGQRQNPPSGFRESPPRSNKAPQGSTITAAARAAIGRSYEKYLLGEHARALQKEKLKPGNQDLSGPAPGNAPTCGDCHSSHYVRSHLSRVETGRNMTEVCGSCHPAQKASYLENYHGKAAVNLGNERAAFCTDCHGAHQCISLRKKRPPSPPVRDATRRRDRALRSS